MEEYTEEDLEKLLEKEKPPFTIYLKAFFLLFVVGGGMLFVNYMAKNGPEAPVEKKPSQTLETILGVTDQIGARELISGLKDDVDSGGVKKALESISNDVKGEASRAADRAIDKSTDSAVGYVYENSVVKVIEKMIETLPQAQRQKLIKTLKARYPVE